MTERPKSPDSKQPAAKRSAARPPAAKTSGTKPPAAKTPGTKPLAAEPPAAKTQAAKTPTAKTPAATTPVTKTPTAKTSLTKMPGGLADPVRPPPPRSIKIAMRLMYAGAGLTGLGLILSVVTILLGRAALKASHPHATAAQLQSTQNFLLILAVFSGLVEIAVWLLVARANGSGLKWARIAASILFAISTWYLVAHLRGDALANLIYTVVTWLVGLGAVFFLWRRESSAYFG